MPTDVILDALDALARATARELWKAARGEANVAKVVFPRYRDAPNPATSNPETPNPATPKRRSSEQEARFCFARLAAQEWFISVETPTELPYNFSGKGGSKGRSAQHDLSLHASVDGKPVAHVEFKHGGKQGVAKDIAKLMGSERPALILHSVEELSEARRQRLAATYRSAITHPPNGGQFTARQLDAPRTVVMVVCGIRDERAWSHRATSWRALDTALDQGFTAPTWTEIVP